MLPMLSCIFSKGHSKMISWPMVMWGVKAFFPEKAQCGHRSVDAAGQMMQCFEAARESSHRTRIELRL